MSFTVRLTPDLISVEAGATAPLSILVSNKNGQPERFEMQVEGLDPEWVATPEPIFTVDPDEDHQERIFFKPPRVSESLAGNYPFVLKVRSLESGESRSAQGVLQIKPYNHLSMEISPKKGYVSPSRKHNVFGVTIMNLGNTEHTLQLYGNDPEDACSFAFEHEQVTVGPGQTKTFEVVVEPTSSQKLGNSRLHGFSISARSIATPSLLASAQGQLEQRPLLTPGTIAFLAAVLVIAALWFAFLPKAPTVDLTVSPMEAKVGDSIRVSWTGHDANSVVLTVNGEARPETDASGQFEYTTSQPGALLIEITPYRDKKEGTRRARTVMVEEVVAAPIPTVKISASSLKVPSGQPIILTYEITGAVSATLQPTGEALELTVNQKQVMPSQPKTVYFIVAKNKDGKTAQSNKVTVTQTDEADVKVIAFEASLTKLPPEGGLVRLDWQLSGAVRVTLQQEGMPAVTKEAVGGEEINITKTTVFTLKGYDAKGRIDTKTIKIVVDPPVTPPPVTDAGDPPTTTGTNSGSNAGNNGGQR